MKKLCWLAASIVVATLAMTLSSGGSAQARPNYWPVFEEKYAKASGVDPAFAATLTKTKCNVCHVKDKEKTDRNTYGVALSKLITKKEKDKDKITGALEKVAAEPSEAGGPTFGDLLKEGKLPGK